VADERFRLIFPASEGLAKTVIRALCPTLIGELAPRMGFSNSFTIHHILLVNAGLTERLKPAETWRYIQRHK